MPNPGLIGRCGIYCEHCIMCGVSHRDEPEFAKIRAKIAKNVDYDVSAVTCQGCP